MFGALYIYIYEYPLISYLGAVVDDGLVDDNILQDLACEARKEIIPRFSRAKNVDNKWVYLAQLGHREFQEVEVIICRHPEHKCVNGVVHQIIHPILNTRIPNFFHEIERFPPITISFTSYKQPIRISNFCNEFLFIYFVNKYWQDKSFKLRPK